MKIVNGLMLKFVLIISGPWQPLLEIVDQRDRLHFDLQSEVAQQPKCTKAMSLG